MQSKKSNNYLNGFADISNGEALREKIIKHISSFRPAPLNNFKEGSEVSVRHYIPYVFMTIEDIEGDRGGRWF